jgi:hypothetical protein
MSIHGFQTLPKNFVCIVHFNSCKKQVLSKVLSLSERIFGFKLVLVTYLLFFPITGRVGYLFKFFLDHVGYQYNNKSVNPLVTNFIIKVLISQVINLLG